jgi:hypothetical protein
MKLFWARSDRKRWIAFSEGTGLVAFPAEMNGWQKRRPVDVSADRLREVPLHLAAYTGMPGSTANKRAGKHQAF